MIYGAYRTAPFDVISNLNLRAALFLTQKFEVVATLKLLHFLGSVRKSVGEFVREHSIDRALYAKRGVLLAVLCQIRISLLIVAIRKCRSRSNSLQIMHSRSAR